MGDRLRFVGRGRTARTSGTARRRAAPPAVSGSPAGAIDRRRFVGGLVAGALAAGLPACSRIHPPLPELARALGLREAEQAWLSVLSTADQRQILRALLDPASASPEIIGLTIKIIGARSRLFVFLDYPRLADAQTACDGLIQE